MLRQAYSAILQTEEDYVEAARVLMEIPLEGGSR